MRILKRPMFKKGGSANEGIMDGLVDRRGYADGSDQWEKLAQIYSPADARSNIDWTGVTEPPMGGTTGSDWLANWFKRQTPKYQAFEKQVTETGEVPVGAIERIPPGEVGGPGYVPPLSEVEAKKKAEVTIDGAKGYDVNSFEDRKSRMSRRQKEFLEMLSPQAKKRAMIDAATAASKAFGESTGDTKQDIANAITAAAEATGGIQDLSMMARKLAIEEDIKLSALEKELEIKSRVQKDSDKVKTVKWLTSEAGGNMPLDQATKHAFGQATSIGEAVSVAVKIEGVGSTTANAVYSGAVNFYGAENVTKIKEDDWKDFKNTAEDGVYVIGKKIYRITTDADGKRQPPKLIVNYTTET